MAAHRSRRLAAPLAALALFAMPAGGVAQTLPYPPLPEKAEPAAARLPYPALADPKLADHRVTGDAKAGDAKEPAPAATTPKRLPDPFLIEPGTVTTGTARAKQPAPGEIGFQPRPALWKIADKDTTIFLFGTIHMLPPGFIWRSDAVDAAITLSDRLILESTDDEIGSDIKLFSSAVAAPGMPPIIDRVLPENRDRLRAFQKRMPAKALGGLDKMPTWLVAMAASVRPEGSSKDGGKAPATEIDGPGADDWLEDHFRREGKPVSSIESGEAVIAALNAIPEETQRGMLNAALGDAPAEGTTVEKELEAWITGDVGPSSPLQIDLKGPDAALAEPLLTRRNMAWTDSLLRELDKPGTVLFAAGAGHFVGDKSLIQLLEQRGIKVERIN